MLSYVENNKRVAKNTLFLYVRMLFLMLIQLYTVPVLLRNLGVEDYGIYNVVGGIVTLFSFLSSSLASGAQRFLAYELGKRDYEKLRKMFSATLTIYLCIAIVIVLLLESLGLWFLNVKMIIPENRIYAANWVYQLSILAFLVNIISIPYNAAIIAREKMSVFAYFSIVEIVLKLGAAVSLSFCTSLDRLIIYAIYILSISLLMRFSYQFYCVRNFVECHYEVLWDKTLIKPLLVYSGFNMIGSLAMISRQQGLNILLNIFFGVLINAAHTLGQQIYGVANQFVNNIYMATRPLITKLYAANQIEEMWQLVYRSARMASYLLLLLCIPLLIEIDLILKFWLGEVPAFTVLIVRLLIISLFIETLTNQVIAVFQAANKIKHYQLWSSMIVLMTIPLAYIALLQEQAVYIPYSILIVLSIGYVISLLWIGNRILNLDVLYYLKQVIARVILVAILSLVCPLLIYMNMDDTIVRLLLVIASSLVWSSLIIWFWGLETQEKRYILNFALKIRNKI